MRQPQPVPSEAQETKNLGLNTEQDFISEAQSRQIFNYRGDTININEWEIPEEGKIAAKLSKWFQEFADEHVTLTKVQNAIKALGRTISDMSDMDKKQELKNSRITDQLLTFVNKEVDPILKEMLDKNVSLEEINKYLHARHAEEYNIQMNKKNPDVVTEDGRVVPYGLKDRASGIHTERPWFGLYTLRSRNGQLLGTLL